MCCSSGIAVLFSSEAISRKRCGREGASKIGASILSDGTWKSVDVPPPPSFKIFLSLVKGLCNYSIMPHWLQDCISSFISSFATLTS